MKLIFLPILLVISSCSTQVKALPPVENNPGYPAPAPDQPAAPQPAPTNVLYDMMGRLEQLQREVQQLTGKVEELAFQNSELKKRVSAVYSDLDERIQSIESKSEGGPQPDDENSPEEENAELNRPEVEDRPEAESPPAEAQDQQSPEAAAAPQPQQASVPEPSQPPQVPEAEKQEFKLAYDAFRNGRTQQSIDGFKAFLARYPSSQLASYAQYGLGDAYRVNQDYDSARKAFIELLQNHPDSAKAPDALLKLGYVEFDLKNWGKAREYLTRVTTDFPNTNAARLAAKKLQSIKHYQSAP
ncbi:MAG: tol-pal system protein YbgF [Gammaproteobacteria bacterium]